MNTNYGKILVKGTPQTERASPDQVKNNAGGYVYALDSFGRLERFLIMGVDGSTYYSSQQKLIRENAQCVEECLKLDGKRVVDMVVDVSTNGRAAKNDPALFVLAMAAGLGDAETKAYALDNLTKIARIGTHLFHFVEYVQNFRGWGRALRRSIGDWYNDRNLENLTNQILKYRQRDGWSNRDLLRLSHPKTNDANRQEIYNWIVKDGKSKVSNPRINGFMDAMKSADVRSVIPIIKEHNLTREMIPTEFLNKPDVLRALLPKMPLGALVRNLANLSAAELTKGATEETKLIVGKLTNKVELKKARIHPIGLLNALYIYKSGTNRHNTWQVNPQIAKAIEDAFYMSFAYIEPSGKNHMLALDVSGSMGWSHVVGLDILTARDVAAVMVMATMKSEPWCQIMAFADSFIELPQITANSSLSEVLSITNNIPFGSTDCAQPMIYALQKKIPVDAFCIYTDSETWCGYMQPMEALRKYRKDMKLPNAKLIVVAATSTGFTIADPNDNAALDVVGFDANAPAAMANFVR